ncbi:hypothetical protein BGZ50_005751 [Haplosporangium sp. Z 11]|nr:hypothetical protein BGZ50_005751 [Haplosporangium sp. Z 11]
MGSRKLCRFEGSNRIRINAAVAEELRFDRSPRDVRYVHQHLRDDENAPVEFSRHNFILKDDETEDEMIEYIIWVFNSHTQE